MVTCEYPRYFWERTLCQKSQRFQSPNHCCSLWGYRAGRASFLRCPIGGKYVYLWLLKMTEHTEVSAFHL